VAADFSLVHLLAAAGRHLLFDGATGALVALTSEDYGAWRGWLASNPAPEDRSAAALKAGGPPHVAELCESGLFNTPAYPGGRDGQLQSLCLNVAHACNLACRYCFASRGGYESGDKTLMSAEIARRGVDFLLAHARPGAAVSVDFFGGEPLLAWDTVVETVGYGRGRARETGTGIEFTITTNGTLVDLARARFLAAEMSTVIVSLDGRPRVHDSMRPYASGGPSYGSALAGAELLAQAIREADIKTTGRTGPTSLAKPAKTMPPESGRMWVRGTFTAQNPDFWRDAEHLVEQGFTQISIEPVTGGAGAPWAIGPSQLPGIKSSYERLAQMAIEGRLRFFHFELNRQRPACAAKRFSGCGAGVHYACVSPGGSIYPCHQFDGMQEYKLGTVGSPGASPGVQGAGPGVKGTGPGFDGAAASRPLLPDPRFAGCHVGTMPACRRCWAQLHCGGGCRHAAATAGGGLYSPPDFCCTLLRLRLEAALGIAAAAATRRPGRSPA
jgi:uncharacterized protein